jgi:hypothetical protein
MDINKNQPKIERIQVPKELKPWKIKYPEYNPISYTSSSVFSNKLSDINSIGEQ